MPCGVTKQFGSQTVVCDNAGTSTHSGPHSGVTSLFGFTGIRVWWLGTQLTPVAYKPLLRNYKVRSATGWVSTIGSTAPPPPPALAAAGMNLASNFVLPDGAWRRVTGWTPRAGFTGVSIVEDQLVMSSEGQVRVRIKGNLTAGGFGYTVSKRLTKNGVAVASWNDVVTEHTAEIEVQEGDKLGFELGYSGFVTSCQLNAGTGTYLYTEVL